MIWHCMALELFIAFMTIQILNLHPSKINEGIYIYIYI